jgi:hypothetical protein
MSKYRVTKVAAQCLIAQINSQCKLATLRRENQKFETKTKFLKQGNMFPTKN